MFGRSQTSQFDPTLLGAIRKSRKRVPWNPLKGCQCRGLNSRGFRDINGGFPLWFWFASRRIWSRALLDFTNIEQSFHRYTGPHHFFGLTRSILWSLQVPVLSHIMIVSWCDISTRDDNNLYSDIWQLPFWASFSTQMLIQSPKQRLRLICLN